MKRIQAFKKMLLVLGSWFIAFVAMAQEREITGVVTDAESNNPLIGASVIVKGTTVGSTADVNGNFTILAKDGDVLLISFVGYISEEIIIAGQTRLSINLDPDLKQLDEVVVIGYGTVKKADATGAVSVVSEEDFNVTANTKPQDLIVGKVAGVVVTPGDGAPTSGAQIRVRGGSSLLANNDPLIVIDGLPVTNEKVGGASNPLASINPNDIESMTVLKDASATAIYGSRASNGVIIITTKKGSKGAIKVAYSGDVSVATIAKQPDLLDGEEFRQLVQEQVAKGKIASSNLEKLGNANTNWQDEIYNNAISTNHNLSASGSAANIPFRLSLGYSISNGLLKESGFNRGTAALNLNPSLLDNHLTVSVNAKTSLTNNNFSNSDAIGRANEFDPTQPVRNGNTRYGGYTAWVLDSDTENQGSDRLPINIATHNPTASIAYRTNTSDVLRLIGNAKFDYKVHYLPELKLTLNLGYDYILSKGIDQTSPLASWSYREPDKNDKNYENIHKNQLFDFYANYNKDIDVIKSNIDFTAGYSYQKFYKEANNFNRSWEWPADSLESTVDKFENYIISFFGRLNYALFNKYLVTVTLRQDGTSRFGENNRWGLFPSYSFAWKINEEPFLSSAHLISELKLRLGYGTTGQQDVGNTAFRHYYPYLAVYENSEPGAYYQRGDQFLSTYRPGPYNSSLKWEETVTQNIGLDFGFANNRITGTFDAYKRETKDMLSEIPIPNGTNFSNFLIANVGTMINQGIEASLNTIVLSSTELRLQIGANFTYNQNEITKLNVASSEEATQYDVGDIAGGVGNKVQVNAVGYAANTFYLFKQYYNKSGMPIEGLYYDKTGEGGNIAGNNDNKYYLKNPAPDYTIGINSSLTYNDFDLSFSGRVNIGNYVYNNNNSNRALYQNIYQEAGGYFSNIPSSINDTKFETAQYRSDVYLENGSFFRMDHITLGYSFSELFTQKLSGRVLLSVQNAFVLTKYSGLDPEISNGIDNAIYPRPRTFLLGFNLQF